MLVEGVSVRRGGLEEVRLEERLEAVNGAGTVTETVEVCTLDKGVDQQLGHAEGAVTGLDKVRGRERGELVQGQ